MRALLLNLSLLLLCACCSYKSIRIPPGTVQLNDSVYIDQTPVTNLDYFEFLSSLNAFWSLRTSDSLKDLPRYGWKGRELSYQSTINHVRYSQSINHNNKRRSKLAVLNENQVYSAPDSLLAKQMYPVDSTSFQDIQSLTLLTHPAYRNFPVVLISKVQAEMYCKWRTDMVNLMILLNTKDSSDYSKYVPIERYRLPTPDEWIEAFSKITVDQNEAYAVKSAYDFGFPLRSVYTAYDKKDDFKFYPFTGVLSEILLTDSTINSNWQDPEGLYTSDTLRAFSKPSSSIGFRCVCEVEKSKKSKLNKD